jgi:hypothetical protein
MYSSFLRISAVIELLEKHPNHFALDPTKHLVALVEMHTYIVHMLTHIIVCVRVCVCVPIICVYACTRTLSLWQRPCNECLVDLII